MAEKKGVKVKEILWTMGRYDLVPGWNNRKAPGLAFPGARVHTRWIPVDEPRRSSGPS